MNNNKIIKNLYKIIKMTEIEKEKLLDKCPLPVTIEGTTQILYQLKNCICKIENKNGKGTGFFCNIPYNNNKLKVLITNNHIINEEILANNKIIKVSINDDKEKKTIELKNRKVYSNKIYDTTIIEINPKLDKISNFLELDENIFEENIELYNRSIYILQYPKSLNEQKAAVSYGIINNIQEKYNIIHYCSTDNGSSGSPIMNLSNNKVIGIHKENVKKYNYNRGTLLKYPINEYLNNNNFIKKNEINMTIEIAKDDINNDIYFINDHSSYSGFTKDKNLYYFDTTLNELNTELYINNKK